MNESAKIKLRIQALLRAIALLRDKGCVLAPFQGKDGVPYCNGFRKDGQLVLQFDHLNSRAFNVSFADPRLGVIVCAGHHTWKTFRAKKQYDLIVRKLIGPARRKLWDAVENDRKIYPMTSWDWAKVLIGLQQDLADLQKAA